MVHEYNIINVDTSKTEEEREKRDQEIMRKLYEILKDTIDTKVK